MSNNIEKYDGEKDLNDTEITVLPESEFVGQWFLLIGDMLIPSEEQR